MDLLNGFLQRAYLDNTVSAYLVALVVLLAGVIAARLVARIGLGALDRLSRRTQTQLDDLAVRLIKKNGVPLLYFVATYLAVASLRLAPGFARALGFVTIAITTFFTLRTVLGVASYLLEHYIKRENGNDQRAKSLMALMPVLSVLVWGVAIVFLLDNMGLRVSAVVASLGIGGIAVALAAQSMLRDFFSHVLILLDRPFELGDFIIVGSYLGTVEHIGIRSTRLRSLSGEELVVSNTDLTSGWIKNYKRMKERRIVFGFGVTYDTPSETLGKIPQVVREVVDNTPNTRFDRAHFFQFGASSLDYQVVYYILVPDYTQYMDAQQTINLQLKQRLELMGVEFAFPTQTVYLVGSPADSLTKV